MTERIGRVLPERSALRVPRVTVEGERRRLMDSRLEAQEREALPRGLLLDVHQDRAPQLLPARPGMHEHAFHFAVAGRIDAQRPAADGLALAPRDEEADVRRTQRVDIEDVVAFRGIERLEKGIERGEEPQHVLLARAFESDGGPQSAWPGYYDGSFRPEASLFHMRSRKVFLFILMPGMLYFPLAAPAAEPWIERSDRNSAIVIELQGAFSPESTSELGVDRFDTAVLDLGPENAKRYDAAAGRALELLSARRKAESDPKVRQDLDILFDAVESKRQTRALEYRLLVPYFDLSKHVFQGLQVLLDARNGESRRRNALQRLRRYAGMEPGSAPLADLARARTGERFRTAQLVWPYEGQVRKDLDNSERYIAGIAELFRSSAPRDWEAAHARLAAQLRSHAEWVKSAVLPRARKEHTLPRELYADRLKTTGIDLEPEQAISMGTFAFTEIRDEAARLAARIAREHNLASADYRDVIRALKRNPVPRDRILALYRDRLKDIEEIVVRERIISLPRRAASIRLASEAESAAIAAPFMNPPRLVGNRGQSGQDDARRSQGISYARGGSFGTLRAAGGGPLCIQVARPGGVLLLRLHPAAGAPAEGRDRARAAFRAAQIPRLRDRAGPSAAQTARARAHARDRRHAMIFPEAESRASRA